MIKFENIRERAYGVDGDSRRLKGKRGFWWEI